MANSLETYSFAATLKARTTKAICIIDHATGEEMWLPLSQVHEIHGEKEVTLVISAWIAKKKGLI